MRKRLSLFPVGVLLFVVCFAFSSGVVSGHPLPTKEAKGTLVTSGSGKNLTVNGLKVVDMRTVALDYPCPGQSRTGVGSIKTGDSVLRKGNCATARSATGKAIPFLNSGPSCSGAVKLLVFKGGVTRFYASNSAYNVGSWVEYYWCPVTGTNGLNWAKGHEYPLSGCNDLLSGNGWGANLEQQYTGAIYTDGDPQQVFPGVCTGNYVYDFSLPADGSYNYLAWMWGGTPAGSISSCQAETPGYA